MSIPENNSLTADNNKSGGEGGTPGIVEETAEFEVDAVEMDEAVANNKSGGEGGTPG